MTLVCWLVACMEAIAINFVADSACYEIMDDGAVRLVVCWSDNAIVAIPKVVRWHNTDYKVTRIESCAFQKCKNAKEINIPALCSYISMSAFADCSSLENIHVDSQNYVYCDVDGVLYSKSKEQLFRYPQGKSQERFSIPIGVKRVEDNAFSHCSLLHAVDFPISLTEIGFAAFVGCHALENVTLPDNLESIGNYAFYDCNNLITVKVLGPLPVFHDQSFSYDTYQKGVLITEDGYQEYLSSILNSKNKHLFTNINTKDNKSQTILFE